MFESSIKLKLGLTHLTFGKLFFRYLKEQCGGETVGLGERGEI